MRRSESQFPTCANCGLDITGKSINAGTSDAFHATAEDCAAATANKPTLVRIKSHIPMKRAKKR